MALLWLSGRTALLVGLFGLAAAQCALGSELVTLYVQPPDR